VARKKKPLPLFEQIEITDIGAEGKAIARIDDKICFVKMAAPGDIVDIQVTKKRKKYFEGRIVTFHKYSNIREEAFCKHFGTCGGCKWQHIPYSLQLEYKQKQVEETLKRIGKTDIPAIRKILGSVEEKFYRNKMEYTFSSHRWLSDEEIKSGTEIKDTKALGFHVPGLFDKIVDIEKCWLQQAPGNEIRNSIRDFANKNDYSFFSQREHSGLLRNLLIRTSTTGELMVIVVFYEDEPDKIQNMMNHISESFPGINSLIYVVNQKANDTLYDQEMIVFKGNDCIYEELEGLKFKIGSKSFFQTNSKQALKLYQQTRDFANLSGNEIVYDLYTGTGTIANFVARNAKKVIGIESVPEAIKDAFVNSEINGINNTDFYAGDMKDLLSQDFIAKHGQPDVIITDPPRAGMHKNVVDTILLAQPERIVYVSCNPATQARDLEILSEKYIVTEVQPVDMFPHTHHVENIVKLEKRK